MEKNSKIYIAGHRGLLGSALERLLRKEEYKNLILLNSSELDLREQNSTRKFFEKEKPEYVFLAAAKVGGLEANNIYRAQFIRDNLQIQTNVIDSSWKSGVKRLLFVASNCVYPKECLQPMKEEFLMTGKFEPTNQPFAIAKMAGIEMCDAYNSEYNTNFITIIPASLYGPGDNYDMVNSHIIPTLIRKCHEAKLDGKDSINLLGSKDRIREMIYVDDTANACLFLMENYESSKPINAGTGKGHTISEIAEKVKDAVGFKGKILFEDDQPSGMMCKILDSSKINSLGWKSKINLEEGLEKSYKWFVENYEAIKIS